MPSKPFNDLLADPRFKGLDPDEQLSTVDKYWDSFKTERPTKEVGGFPIKSSKELQLDDYFKSRPDVTGMAWGGGENGSDPSEPRVVVHNPFNKDMEDPSKRNALYRLEASRHLMSQTEIPAFEITPEMQKWRKKKFVPGKDPYATDDKAFRETLVSRVMVGDDGSEIATPEVKQIADSFRKKIAPTDAEFADAQRGAAKAMLTIRKQAETATEAEKRLLRPIQHQLIDSIDIGNDRAWGRIDEPEFNRRVSESKAKQAELDKDANNLRAWLAPETQEGMAPVLSKMDELATNSNKFGNAGMLLKAVDLTSGGPEKSGLQYDLLKTQITKDFGLTGEEVDDVIKHRLGLYEGKVSRDALGTLHIRDEILSKPLSEIEAAVRSSGLPNPVKERTIRELPQRVQRFKQGVVANVLQNHKELAANLGVTPEDVDGSYSKINDTLQTSRAQQFGGGLKEFGGRSFLTAPQASSITGVTPDRYQDMKQEAVFRKDAVARQASINALSGQLNRDKTSIWGTDAATVGQGAGSAVESVIIAAATSGLGNVALNNSKAVVMATRYGKLGEYAAKGIRSAADIAPLSVIYGTQQGAQTFEDAMNKGMGFGDALKLGALSAVFEGGITMLASGLGAGGTEQTLSELMKGSGRAAAKRSILRAWAAAGGKTATGIGSELLEETAITFMDSLFVQSKINPKMTLNDIGKSVWDTAIATVASSGPLAAFHGFKEQGRNLFTTPTHELDDAELQARADAALAPNLAPEKELPKGTTPAGADKNAGPAPVAGTATASPLVEMTPDEFSAAKQERIQELRAVENPSPDEAAELKLLDTASDEEIAKELGVNVAKPQETLAPAAAQPTETLPAGQAAPSVEGAAQAPVATITSSNEKEKGQGQGREEVLTPATEAPLVSAGGAVAPISEQPSENLAPRSTQTVEPRPERQGRDTSARDAWDEKYGTHVRGGRTHNDDGTPYQPTVFDETVPKIIDALSGKTFDEKLDAVGTDTGAELGTGVRQLLNDGWVWDNTQGRMVDPKNRGETPRQALNRIRNRQPQTQQTDGQDERQRQGQGQGREEVLTIPEGTTAQIARAKELVGKDELTRRAELWESANAPNNPRLEVGLENAAYRTVKGDWETVEPKLQARIDARTTVPTTTTSVVAPVVGDSLPNGVTPPIGTVVSAETRPGQPETATWDGEAWVADDGTSVSVTGVPNRVVSVPKMITEPAPSSKTVTEPTKPVTKATPASETVTRAPTFPEAVSAFENSEKTEEDIARVILAMSGLVPESDAVAVNGEEVQDGPLMDKNGQLRLFQNEEVSDPSVPRGFYDTARRAGTAVIGFVQGVSRPDTGVHESAHAIYEFLVESGEVTKEQQAAFDQWQSNGNPKATWEEKNEKFADGFIKFVLDGVSTGIDVVDAVFAKITKSLVAIYKNLSSSRVNMEIPQEVREIFEKIIKRGYELEQAGKPLQKVPVKITTISKADAPRIPQTKPTTPRPTAQSTNKVTKKLPKYKAPVVGVGLRQELTDEVRNKYDLPGSRAVLGQTDQEAWDAALLSIAEADRYENASEQERIGMSDPPLVGDRLIHDLIDNPRMVDKTGRALLAHALLVKKQNLDGLRKKISALPTTASKLDRSELTRQENEAILQLSVVVKTIERQGSLAGLALQAMKMVVNEEFELDTMLAQALNWKRSSGQNAGSSVLSETEKKRVGEIQARLERAQKELDDAMADNEMLSNENAAYERELLALVEKQAKREKTPPSEQKRATVAKKITDRVSSARDRLAKMGFGGRLFQRAESEVNDAEYLAAVERGDMETAQRMVDEAAWKSLDRLIDVDTKFYKHSSWAAYLTQLANERDTKGETKYVTENRAEAESEKLKSLPYLSKRNQLLDSLPQAYVMLQPGIRFIAGLEDIYQGGGIDFEENSAPYQELTGAIINGGSSRWLLVESGEIERGTRLLSGGINRSSSGKPKDIIEQFKRRELSPLENNEDSVSADNKNAIVGIRLSDGDVVRSADPVTYDAQGKVIPLSQRFNPESPSILYQKPEPESLDPQVLSDLADVGVEYLNNGDATVGKFTEALVNEFGDAIKPHAKQILAESRKRFKTVAATTKGPRSVEQLLADVDSENPQLTRELVYNMAKAVYNQGFRKEEILTEVTSMLQDEFPGVTRTEVADAFTGYGKIKYPSQEKIDKDLRELRNAERITRQIEDVESGQPPKKTGTQRDKATVWVREKMALLKAAMKKAGMESIPGADRLKGTLDSIKSNYRNRIEELERAIANHEKLPPKTRGVTYDEEATQLKEKAAKLKEEYDGIFGENKDLTEEQRMERAVNSLSRRIKEEKDMRAAGQTKRVPGKPAPDSPAIRILREELKALVDARHAAAKALVDSRTPEERALDRAVRSVEKSIAENERILATGQLPAPRADAPSYTPSQWLQTQRDRLQTLQRQVAKLRRDNRPRLSAEEKERRRAISYLTKAITRLQSVVNAGVVVSRTRPDSSKYDPAVSLLRREHARLKAQVQDIRKSLKGPRDPEILLLSQLRRKLAAIRDRIKRGDFTKTTKQPKQYSDRVVKAKLEIAEANAEWNRFRGQMLIAQASKLKRLTRTLNGLWQLRKIIVMGLEPGALGRQAGRALLANWWNFRNFSIIGKSLRAGFSRAKEFEYYDQFVNRPGSVWDKVGGIVLHSPREEGYKNKEDLPDPEILEALSRVKALKYPTEVLLFFERFTRTLLNAQRVTEFDGFNPKNREEAILFGNAVMNVTGRGSFEDTKLETGVMLANYAVISTRWYISRAKLAILEPVWSNRQDVGYKGTAKARLRILNKYYAQYYMGKAILTFSLMAIAAMRNGWDDDDNDWKEQLNPLSSKFLTFRYKGSVVDTGSGVRQFINLLTRAGAGKKMNSNGEIVDITGDDKPFTPDLSDEVSNFAFDRMNVNLAFMLQTANRRYRNGDEVTPLNVLKNLLTPITAGDARTLFETYETDEAAALYVLSYLGFSVFTKDANRSKFSTEPRY